MGWGSYTGSKSAPLFDLLSQPTLHAPLHWPFPPQDVSPSGGGGGGGTALTWQELRLAAEAGFDELMRQETERAMDGDAGGGAPDQLYTGAAGGRNRSPYRSPLAMQRALAAAGE